MESYTGAPFARFSGHDMFMSVISACVREILFTTLLFPYISKTYVKKLRLVTSKQFNDEDIKIYSASL